MHTYGSLISFYNTNLVYSLIIIYNIDKSILISLGLVKNILTSKGFYSNAANSLTTTAASIYFGLKLLVLGVKATRDPATSLFN